MNTERKDDGLDAAWCAFDAAVARLRRGVAGLGRHGKARCGPELPIKRPRLAAVPLLGLLKVVVAGKKLRP